MNKNEKFVITINREVGSGGRTVGRILAEKLGQLPLNPPGWERSKGIRS